MRRLGYSHGMRGSQLRRPVGRAKGRPVDAEARQAVLDLLGERPRRRDLLIEYLHLIQDSQACLPAAMLNALADELRPRHAIAQV